MMNIRNSSVALVVCAAACLSADAAAASHVSGPLKIGTDGVAVFACVPKDEGESVDVDAAGIYSMLKPGLKLDAPWGISLADGGRPISLAPGQCLSAGAAPQCYSSGSDGSQVQDDRPYSFDLRSPELGKYRTRNHSGIFCLRRSGARLQVVTVPRGPATVNAKTCGDLLDAAASASELAR